MLQFETPRETLFPANFSGRLVRRATGAPIIADTTSTVRTVHRPLIPNGFVDDVGTRTRLLAQEMGRIIMARRVPFHPPHAC